MTKTRPDNVIDLTAPSRPGRPETEGTGATGRRLIEAQGGRLARQAPPPFPGSPFCSIHERRLVDCLLELGAAGVRADCREA